MSKQLTWEQTRVRRWILKNRGILTRIAVTCRCSHQFVQALAYGRSTARPGHEVERELLKHGWPGVRRERKSNA